jgi:hypothetical protein
VVVEDLPEDLVDRGFGISAAGIAVILPLLTNGRSWSGGSARRPSAFSSIVGQYDAGAADLASEIPQAVPFRGGGTL